jgi:glycosyltransferase involved in cell wall biosynthesis
MRRLTGWLPSPVRTGLRRLLRAVSGAMEEWRHRSIGSPSRPYDDVARVLRGLQTHLVPELEKRNAEAASHYWERRAERARTRPDVAVEIVYRGEPQLEACRRGMEKQTYPSVDVRIIDRRASNPRASGSGPTGPRGDLLVSLNAATVVTDHLLMERVVESFVSDPRLVTLDIAARDDLSDAPTLAISVTRLQRLDNRKPLDDRSAAEDGELTVRHGTVWHRFLSSAVHAPDPDPIQAFRLGAQRGIDVIRGVDSETAAGRAVQDPETLIAATWRRCRTEPQRSLALATIGADLALRGRITSSEEDLDERYLLDHYERYRHLTLDELVDSVHDRGARPTADAEQQRRCAFSRTVGVASHNLLFLVPHFGLYGGVLRYFELARAMRANGHDAVITALPGATTFRQRRRPMAAASYADVPILPLGDALERSWNVAVCGDYSSGVMCLLPWVDAEVRGAMILNGWQKRAMNLEQIYLADPDIVIANSSYAAGHYPEVLPSVVAGGVDLGTFNPIGPVRAAGGRVRIAVPGGRDLPAKRLRDAVRACEAASTSGVPVELHVWNAGPLRLQTAVPHAVHVGLDRRGVADLLRSMDLAICPEEDAGWNNPAAEAMASGVPLICTEAGTTDFAFDGATAVVVEPRRPSSIQEAILRLVEDREEAERLRTTGLEVIRGFGWPKVADRLLVVLESPNTRPRTRHLAAAQQREAITLAVVRSRTAMRLAADGGWA